MCVSSRLSSWSRGSVVLVIRSYRSSFPRLLANRTPPDFSRIQQNLGRRLRMHALLRAIGVLALIAGLGFMGNGFRFFAYPGERFMMVYYGAGMAVIGLLLIIFSRPSDEPRT